MPQVVFGAMLDAGRLERRGPGAVDVSAGMAANMDDEPGTVAFPPAQVRQQRARYRNGRRALLRFGDADAAAVHDAARGVDVPALGVRHELQTEDGVGARARIERDQDEAGKVPALRVAVRGPEQSGGFAAGQPSVARWGFRRQLDLHRRGQVALGMAVVDGRGERAQFLAHGGPEPRLRCFA